MALEQPIQDWDNWLMTLICERLDPTMAGEWYLQLDNKGLSLYVQMEFFLSKHVSTYIIGYKV